MSACILTFLVFAAGLFVCKLLYVFATAGALPMTQGAVFTSTAGIRIKSFLDAVPMNGAELLVDLGCGDGRVLRAARRRYGVRTLGFEVNALAYGVARILSFPMRGVRIRCKNFWSEDLQNADVVFCYLFPDVMRRLALKLQKELQPGARVVSCNFPVPGWKPLAVVRPESACHNDPIYVYRLPDSCASSENIDR
jgi:SAM-dependent methyltransferase